MRSSGTRRNRLTLVAGLVVGVVEGGCVDVIEMVGVLEGDELLVGATVGGG